MLIEHTYDVAPSSLLATLVSPDYLAARMAKFGGVGDPAVTERDGATEVKITRQLPMDKLPAAAAPFVGNGQLVQTDVWTATTDPISGTWKAEVGTAPVDIHGTYVLAAQDAGTHYVVDASVAVNVPFFGRQLQPQIESYLHSLVSAEQDFLAEWVASH